MSLLLAISEIYVPQFVRTRKLEMLFDATADAFGTSAPSIRGLSSYDSLRLFANFTRKRAAKSIKEGRRLEVETRLFQNAYQIGRQVAADFRIETPADVMRVGKTLYKYLRIEFQGESDGEIVIPRCFFSQYYSADVCALVSSLDEGLFTGLSGGGKFSFSQRITEGNGCCRAHLDWPKGLK